MSKTYTYTLSKGEFVGGRNNGKFSYSPTFSLWSGYYRLGTAKNGSTNYGYQYCINAPITPQVGGTATSIKLTVTHSKISYNGQWQIAYKKAEGTGSFTYTDKVQHLPSKSSTTNTIDLTSYGVPTYGVLLYQDSTSYAQQYVTVNQITLTIVTDEEDYVLSYDANGGSGAPSSETVTGSGSASVTISSLVPTRANYLFKGWALTANTSTAQYSPGQTITISANTTLYAVWALLSSKLYFDSQGGSPCSPKEIKLDEPYGELPIPVYFGYNFLGWSPYPGRERLFITSSTIVPKPGNSIVFAQWARDCEIFIDMRELERNNG